MIRTETYCKVRKGILKLTHEEKFKDSIKHLFDGNYKIVIEKIYNKRSNPQNAYLWGVVYPVVRDGLIDTGFDEFKQDYDLEMTHELCKFRFLKAEIVSEDGEVMEIIGSTRRLRTVEFMEYLNSIGKWASEYLSVFIPEPDANYAETHEDIY